MLGDLFLDLLDGDPPVIGAQKIAEHFLCAFKGDGAPDQIGIGEHAVERPFELPHIGGDAVGEKFQDAGINLDFPLLDLGLQDAEAEFIIGRVNVGDEAPAEAGAHPLLHPFKIRRRAVAGDDDLMVLIHQRIEGMEEFFLCTILPGDELDIVNHQHIDGAELLLEIHSVLVAQGANETVHEFFRR